MDFVDLNLAKKLKEKAFSCQYPIAMYNERGDFHALYSSAGIENYYDYDNFDEHDCVCPTISQVLKWLREEKKVEIVASFDYEDKTWGYQVGDMTLTEDSILAYRWNFPTYEQAALTGVAYCLENLI